MGESEVMLRKWMMGRDTLGYSGRIGSMNLEELASGDYPTFSSLIWHRELTSFTLLLLTDSKTILFGVGSMGIGIHCTRMW